MNQDQFCDGVRLLGGKAAAAKAIDINERTLERIMKGAEDLGAPLALRLVNAVNRHRRACANFIGQFDTANLDAA